MATFKVNGITMSTTEGAVKVPISSRSFTLSWSGLYTGTAHNTRFTMDAEHSDKTITLSGPYAYYTTTKWAENDLGDGILDYEIVGESGSKTITANQDLYDATLDLYCTYPAYRYYATFVRQATVTINTFTVTQQTDGTAKFSCRATGSYGSGNITYTVQNGSETLFSTTGSSGSTITQTYDIASKFGYGTSCTFKLTVAYSTADSKTKSVTKTFGVPELSSPMSVTISKEIGETAELNWDALTLLNTTGTITYYIYKDGQAIASTFSPPYTLQKIMTSTWGTDPVTLTVKAEATDLSNTYSGEKLEVEGANSVSFKYGIEPPGKPTNLNVNGESTVYIKYGETFTLSWDPATYVDNNPITGYSVFQNGIQVATDIKYTSWPYAVAHGTPGESYTYTVQAIGEKVSGDISDGLVVYSYSDPEAPTEIMVTNPTPNKDTELTLYWKNANSGSYNSIKGYHVYKSTSEDGEYICIDDSIVSTSTSGYCRVLTTSEIGESYYKVLTVGERSNSELSDAYAVIETLDAPCEEWDVIWECTTAIPPSDTWEIIKSPGTITFKDTYGPSARLVCTNGTASDQGAALRLKDYTSRFGQKCAFEIEALIESVQTDTGGIRIILGAGNANGTAAGKGIKTTINQSSTDGKTYMHVLQGTDVIGTQRKNAEISLLEWHKIRLTIDTVQGASTVSVDGQIIAMQSNAQLSTMDTSNTWFNAKNGTCYVRALRYRNEDVTIKTFSVTQNDDGTATFSCMAIGASGSENITYSVKNGSTTIFSTTGSSGSEITKTFDIASTFGYGTSHTFNLTASYNTTASKTKTITKTFDAPAIIAPTSLAISKESGETAELTWNAAELSNTTGTIQYDIYKNGAEILKDVTQPYTLTKDLTSTWGESPVTLTVKAIATNLSNTYLDEQLEAYSNNVQFTYAIEYTKPGKPTNLNVSGESPAYIKHGQGFTLSWDASEYGEDNLITSYTVFRDGEEISTNIESTSWSHAIAHSTPGGSYTYAVQAIGEHLSGDVSDGLIVYSYSDPSIPTNVTIGGGSDAYILNDPNVAIAWDDANAGSYNEITGYVIYQDGVEFRNVTTTEADVPTNQIAGSSYTYSVATHGVRSNSEQSSNVVVYTYSNPDAPLEVTVSNASPDKNTEVVLSWQNAKGGFYNQITGYQVYRATSENGEYICIKDDIESTYSGDFYNVTSPDEMGASYYYKIRTIGERSNSELSDAYAIVTSNLYTACEAPDFFAVNKIQSDGSPVLLSWSGAKDGSLNTITGYDIQYQDCEDGVTWPNEWIDLATDWPETDIDVFPPDTIGWYRRFQIRVKGSAGDEYHSEWFISTNLLRKGMDSFKGFTDPNLTSKVTYVKAIHMTEIQDRINALLVFNNKEEIQFTKIVAGETNLSGWTNHINEIRNAISILGIAPSQWITIEANTPRIDVINEIRNLIS